MTYDNSVLYSKLKHHLPPEQPDDYVMRDQFLSRKYGEGVMKSIKKEREGMMRLFDAVEEELNEETRKLLLQMMIDEMEKLDHLEDRAVPLESKGSEGV